MPVTKICRKCNNELSIGHFTKHYSTRDGLRHECRQCRTIEAREERLKDPEKRNVRNRKRYRANKNKVLDYKKTHPCIDCGETDVRVLGFHHLRDKKYVVARMAMYSWDRTIKEIEKCVVLCANCHLKRHYKELV